MAKVLKIAVNPALAAFVSPSTKVLDWFLLVRQDSQDTKAHSNGHSQLFLGLHLQRPNQLPRKKCQDEINQSRVSLRNSQYIVWIHSSLPLAVSSHLQQRYHNESELQQASRYPVVVGSRSLKSDRNESIETARC